MTDWISREMNILKLENSTKEFIQVFKSTDCQDCYENCEQTNEDVFNCISEHFKDYLIINKKGDVE